MAPPKSESGVIRNSNETKNLVYWKEQEIIKLEKDIFDTKDPELLTCLTDIDRCCRKRILGLGFCIFWMARVCVFQNPFERYLGN